MDFGWLYELWQLPNVKAAVVTLILTLFADVVRRVILPRGRVAWGVTYNEHFILPQQQTTPQQTEQPTLPITLPSINVRVRQIFIQNIGRAVADEVEVTINFKPQYWHVFPPILQELPNDQDRFLRFQAKMLNKKEFFTLSLFESRGNLVLPDVITVRWKGGVAKQVQIVPRQKLPNWVDRIILAVLFVGFISVLYAVIRFAIFVF